MARFASGVLVLHLAAACAGRDGAQPPDATIANNTPAKQTVVIIHADSDWYRGQPAPEQTLTGVLERRNPVNSPGGRALTFQLATEIGVLPVYQGHASERLTRHLGEEVIIRGKIVDLSFGPELWPGTITRKP